MPVTLAVAEPKTAARNRKLRAGQATASRSLAHLSKTVHDRSKPHRPWCPKGASVGEISAEAQRSSFCRSKEPSALQGYGSQKASQSHQKVLALVPRLPGKPPKTEVWAREARTPNRPRRRRGTHSTSFTIESQRQAKWSG